MTIDVRLRAEWVENVGYRYDVLRALGSKQLPEISPKRTLVAAVGLSSDLVLDDGRHRPGSSGDISFHEITSLGGSPANS